MFPKMCAISVQTSRDVFNEILSHMNHTEGNGPLHTCSPYWKRSVCFSWRSCLISSTRDIHSQTLDEYLVLCHHIEITRVTHLRCHMTGKPRSSGAAVYEWNKFCMSWHMRNVNSVEKLIPKVSTIQILFFKARKPLKQWNIFQPASTKIRLGFDTDQQPKKLAALLIFHVNHSTWVFLTHFKTIPQNSTDVSGNKSDETETGLKI